MYALTKSEIILRTTDNASIPPDSENLDYTAYLAWVSAGNVPTPYVSPSAPPLQATPYQFRAALNQLNLRTQVESVVASSTNQMLKDAWQYAQIFREDDDLIISMASVLGQTTIQVHALFQLAQTLSP